jgi:glyoxylate reductase
MTAQRLPKVAADGPLAAAVLELLAGKVDVLDWDVALAGDAVCEGIYTYGHPRVDDAMLARLPRVRIISNYGVGVDHIDLEAARRRGIPVGNTPGILDGATADLAFSLLLASARRIAEGDRYARSPEFTRYDPAYILGREVHHATLGIVGLGRIGRQVARRARGFDMRVLYCNRNRLPESEERQLGVEFATFDELLAVSDYVLLMVPLTDETRRLIDARALAKMKRTATLVNVSRGPVVDTRALNEALRDGTIAAAALDVTDPEPLPRDHPLLNLANLTIVPHLGSATIETLQEMAEVSVANLLAGLSGQPLLDRVV